MVKSGKLQFQIVGKFCEGFLSHFGHHLVDHTGHVPGCASHLLSDVDFHTDMYMYIPYNPVCMCVWICTVPTYSIYFLPVTLCIYVYIYIEILCMFTTYIYIIHSLYTTYTTRSQKNTYTAAYVVPYSTYVPPVWMHQLSLYIFP